MRSASSYRGARRNLARGGVWSSVFYYEKANPRRPRRVIIDQPKVTAAVAGIKRRV